MMYTSEFLYRHLTRLTQPLSHNYRSVCHYFHNLLIDFFKSIPIIDFYGTLKSFENGLYYLYQLSVYHSLNYPCTLFRN